MRAIVANIVYVSEPNSGSWICPEGQCNFMRGADNNPGRARVKEFESYSLKGDIILSVLMTSGKCCTVKSTSSCVV